VTAALRLEEILGYELPSALVHEAPTPRALAEALEQCRPRQAEHLTVLQPGGPGAPLFCLADLFGRPFSYLSLSRHLAKDRPVLGLSPGPLEDTFAASGDIAALTEAFRRAVRDASPQGPYLVAGYSAAGVLAFDLACALEREGAPVALILLDSSMRSRRPPLGRTVRWAARQSVDLLNPKAFPGRYERLLDLRGKLAQSLAARPPEQPPEWIPPGKTALATRLMSACATYRAGKFHGPVLLIKSAERDRIDVLLDHDNMLGWRGALLGPVTTAEVDGDHHAFMREPRVVQVAEHMSRFIEASLGNRLRQCI
jgi:thioesterase domain-containing protein